MNRKNLFHFLIWGKNFKNEKARYSKRITMVGKNHSIYVYFDFSFKK